MQRRNHLNGPQPTILTLPPVLILPPTKRADARILGKVQKLHKLKTAKRPGRLFIPWACFYLFFDSASVGSQKQFVTFAILCELDLVKNRGFLLEG